MPPSVFPSINGIEKENPTCMCRQKKVHMKPGGSCDSFHTAYTHENGNTLTVKEPHVYPRAALVSHGKVFMELLDTRRHTVHLDKYTEDILLNCAIVCKTRASPSCVILY